jgi:polyhydroxybutyrate depolymerase
MSRFAVAALLLLGAWRSAVAADNPTKLDLKVEGTDREALVFVPENAKIEPCPVLFAFHGHGGTMKSAAANMAFQKHWPEAIVVYMQGLNTPGVLVDPEGKRPGWQNAAGQQGDRDLKFFDAMLASLKKVYRVDEKRIYATGHSNGGAFTFVVWGARGDVLAAVAPSSGAVRQSWRTIKPKPAFVITGENDPLVKFEWQQKVIEQLRKLNGCEDGKPWDNTPCTEYPSKTDTPLVTYIHKNGHGMPKDETALIVKFFKKHALQNPIPKN